MEDESLVDELSNDFDDPYCTDSLTAEQKDFADDIISVFDEFLTHALHEEFTSYPNLVHHFDEYCLGNKEQRESSYKNVYYVFKTLRQYDHYEQAFCNDIKANAIYLDSLYDRDVVSKAFREFFEGGKCLVLTASCGFKNKQGSVSIALRSFSSNATLNYKGGNTIDLAVQSYFPKTISLYPIDSWRLEARLNGIINKYNGDSDKIGKVSINNPKERRGDNMNKKDAVKEAIDKDAILKRKDALIARRKEIVDAATKRQRGTGYWHLVSTDFTKEEQKELDEIAKELGSLLSDWMGSHELNNTDENEDKPLEEQSNEKPMHLRDIVKSVSNIVLYNNIGDAHFLNFLPSSIDEDADDAADSEDASRLSMTDSQIKTIPDEDVHKITNIELLDRICKVDKTKLSDEQIKLLKALYKEKVVADEADIRVLLGCIQKCNSLFTEARPVNMRFMSKYGLKDDDVLGILKHLTVSDYYRSTRSINFNHLGNNLLIFEPIVNFGSKQQQLCIYLKLDVDLTSGDCVVLVSIHEGKHQDAPYPNNGNGIKRDESSGSPIEESRKQTAVKSNGVYSVLRNKWVKEPVANDIPNIDNEAFESLFKEWEDKYFNLIESNGKTKEDIIDLIEDLYDLRKSSIAEDGEYGLGNLVFKEMRSMGYLDNLREIKKELSSKELSLEGLDESFAISELDTLEKIRAINLPHDGTFTLDGKGNPQEVDFQSGYQASFFRPEMGNADLNAILNAIGNKLGDVYLGRFSEESELSYHFGNKDKAMGFAQIFNQHSVFDWEAKGLILNPNHKEDDKVDYNKAMGELKKFLGN